MKFVIVFLVIVLIALAVMLRTQSTKIGDLQRQIHDLDAQLAEKAKADTLDLQAKCSEQARKAFADLEIPKNEKNVASYENHYNAKLNKCFIHVEHHAYTPGTIWTHRHVFDAFEGKVYGAYMWHTDKVKKYWEVPPIKCEVTLPSGEKKDCHSNDEFTELVKVYMEGN